MQADRLLTTRERGDEIFNKCVEDFIHLLFKRRLDEIFNNCVDFHRQGEDEILNTIVEAFIRPPFK